jgi:hypothetical protein
MIVTEAGMEKGLSRYLTVIVISAISITASATQQKPIAVGTLETRMSEFDNVYGGHFWQSGCKPLPASYVSDMRKATEGVFSGDIIAKPYTIGGSGWASTYGTATVAHNAMNLHEPGKPNKNESTLSEAGPGVVRIRDYYGYDCA